MNIPPTVIVTGATGFLGGALCRYLHARKHLVIALGRNPAKIAALRAMGLDARALDLAIDVPAIDRLFASAGRSAAVVHCAALSAPWGRRDAFHAANVTATQHLLNASKSHGISKFVHISTPAVHFDYAIQRQLVESAPWPMPPANSYVETKRIAETLAAQAMKDGLPTMILRPKALFGPGDTTLLPRVMKLAAKGRFPRIGDDVELDLTWIDDACEAIFLALASKRTSGTYFITSGKPLSRDLVFQTLFEASGLKVRWKPIPRSWALALGAALEAVSRVTTGGKWEPPLTRYTVGTLAYGQTLDISAAAIDLCYKPKTDVLAKLRECGKAYHKTI